MRILVCEAGPLTPDTDAGGRAVADLIAGLGDLGHEVCLLVESQGEVVARAAAIAPDLIVISRPGLFARLEPLLRPLDAPIVFWAHDLHFVRLGLQAELDPGRGDQAARVMRMVEARCFLRADLAVLPTAEEALRAGAEFPGARVMAVPYFAMPEQPLPTGPPDGERVVFVGGEHHAPNRDGIDWFLGEVWPGVRLRNPATELVVVGRWHRARPWPDRVQFHGVIPEGELDALLRTARVGIAPLRFGAGMKRKTLHYLSHGIPVVGTRFAVQGLEADPAGAVAGVVSAESASEWLRALESLGDGELWRSLSRAGHGFVREAFSLDRYHTGLRAVLDRAQRPRG